MIKKEQTVFDKAKREAEQLYKTSVQISHNELDITDMKFWDAHSALQYTLSRYLRRLEGLDKK